MSDTLPAVLVPVNTNTSVLVRKDKYKRLAKQAMRTADKASTLLPKIVDEIENRLNPKEGQEGLDNKSLIAAGSLLERLSQHRANVARMAGLTKNGTTEQKPSTIVNIQLYSELPIGERIKRIQAEVSGIPRIEPASFEAKSPVEALEGPPGGSTPRTDSTFTPPEQIAPGRSVSLSGGPGGGIATPRTWVD